MNKELAVDLVALCLDDWLWKGDPDTKNRLYSIAGPNDSDCPYECAEDLVKNKGMVQLVFEDGETIDVLYADIVNGLDKAMEHHGIFGEFWAERCFLLLRHAKTQNQWAKQVFRDTLIFAAYGEQGHELV